MTHDAPAQSSAPPLSVDLPLSAAVQELTGFETLAIEDHFGLSFEKLGPIRTLLGAVWVYGNRGDRSISWAAVKNMNLKQLGEIFEPEPPDAEFDEPNTALGKESGTGESRITRLPIGA